MRFCTHQIFCSTLARAITIEKKHMKPVMNHRGLVITAALPNTEACIDKRKNSYASGGLHNKQWNFQSTKCHQ
jgi:hypothetical protein